MILKRIEYNLPLVRIDLFLRINLHTPQIDDIQRCKREKILTEIYQDSEIIRSVQF